MSVPTPPGSVVVGVDGSPLADLALDWAVDEALRRRTGLHVLYAFPLRELARSWGVVPDPESDEGGAPIVHAAAERARSRATGLSVSTEISVLDPAEALVEASREAAVVVMGARGLGLMSGMLLGSVSHKVAGHAHGPVVVVREGAESLSGPVLVGMDPREGAPEAMEYAFEEAARRGVGVRVLQSLSSAATRSGLLQSLSAEAQEQVREEARRRTDERLAEWQERYPGTDVDLVAVEGHPAAELVEFAKEACLVVVGSRGRSGLAGLLLGSVSVGVLHRAPAVAVVRVHREEAGAGA